MPGELSFIYLFYCCSSFYYGESLARVTPCQARPDGPLANHAPPSTRDSLIPAQRFLDAQPKLSFFSSSRFGRGGCVRGRHSEVLSSPVFGRACTLFPRCFNFISFTYFPKPGFSSCFISTRLLPCASVHHASGCCTSRTPLADELSHLRDLHAFSRQHCDPADLPRTLPPPPPPPPVMPCHAMPPRG